MLRPAVRALATVAILLGGRSAAQEAPRADGPPAAGHGSRPADARDPIPEFNRDIRPLLSDRCFQCHGPDGAQRQADLRLDVEESVRAGRDGVRAVVPGRPQDSEVIRRVAAPDESERMPPPEAGRALHPREIDLLRRWIAAGAPWQQHWSFIPPARTDVPAVKDPAWARSPLDAFVLARLEQVGLPASPAAGRATLL
ncbi:MAG TPA: c-type cytochrome domain-containing protein, partial [Planctomycetaceae bacterium]|nr:c-type cytochrome domain-containing protein [Planctomycetaceae bacterium]